MRKQSNSEDGLFYSTISWTQSTNKYEGEKNRQGDTVLDEKKFKGHDQMKYVDPGFQNNE